MKVRSLLNKRGGPHRGVVWFVRCAGALTEQQGPTQHSRGHTRGRHHESTFTISVEVLEASRRVGRASLLRQNRLSDISVLEQGRSLDV